LIDLAHIEPIGIGSSRTCYDHPSNPNLCLKVPFQDRIARKKQKRENLYFLYLQQRKIDFSHISQFRGKIETTLGEAYCFDKPLDSSGETSKTLLHYITEGQIPRENLNKALHQLGNYLLNQGIVFHDINTSNILLQKETANRFRLIIIDGLGDASFLKIINKIPSIRSRTIQRRWNRVMRRLIRYHQWSEADITPLTNRHE